MKKNTLFIFILLSALACQSQEKQIKFYVSPKLGHLNIDGFQQRNYGGFDLDVKTKSNWSLHYSLYFGKKYFHMPLAPFGGLITGFWAGERIANQNDDRGVGPVLGGVLVFIITSVIPEGVNYNIAVNDYFTFAPFISPLQFEYLSTEVGTDSFAGGSAGLRMHISPSSKSMRFSPSIEYKVHYSKNAHPGLSFGMGVGIPIKR